MQNSEHRSDLAATVITNADPVFTLLDFSINEIPHPVSTEICFRAEGALSLVLLENIVENKYVLK